MGKGFGLVWLAVLAMSACAHSSSPESTGERAESALGAQASTPPGETEGAADATGAGESQDVLSHMQANFHWAVRARDAIVAGRLEQARDHARKLREQGAWQGFPPDWGHYLEQMRQRADEIVLAGSMQEAAVAVGRLGVSCGNCHWYAERGPDIPRTSPMPWRDPPESEGQRMLRHDVGIAQMWLGLVQPSEQAFRDGTITLTRAPLKPPQRQGEPVGELQQAALERVRELARQARTAPSHDDRAQIYGQLLVQCASCHEAPPR